VRVRITAKVDYGVRIVAELAATEDGLSTRVLAERQQVPYKFLTSILQELADAQLVRSDGEHHHLLRGAETLKLGDVFRVLEGPLANIRDPSLTSLSCPGAAEHLPEVWMAVRASLRSVLDVVTFADLVSGELPTPVQAMVTAYRVERTAG
jgi:Rrf2 family protein